ncbi:hypothetical protein EC957_001902, partial [Mortierella hygrophila]
MEGHDEFDMGQQRDSEDYRTLGPNRTMPMLSLTKKLCWLLVTCGLLRPEDLLCTDARASQIVDGNLGLEVLFPKEMRGGQTIIKPVVIRSHLDEALCS